MKSNELKRRFTEFFIKREHIFIPSTGGIFNQERKTIFSSGIEAFEKYYTSELDPEKDNDPRLAKPLASLNAVSSQLCLRPQDAIRVGDKSHLTLFEMLGAYSFGGYKKLTAIKITNDFLKNLNLFIDYVTVFGGGSGFSSDNETENIWKEFDVTYIQRLGLKENFWGPAGSGGICGPTSEIYVKDLGIWSMVFLDYYYPGTHEELVAGKNLRNLQKLDIKGIAIITGLERLATAVGGRDDIFKIDPFLGLISGLNTTKLSETQKKIFIDNLRSTCFAFGLDTETEKESWPKPVQESLKNILRKILAYEIAFNITNNFTTEICKAIINFYPAEFSDQEIALKLIEDTLEKERLKSAAKIKHGFEEIHKIKKGDKVISAPKAYSLHQIYELPLDTIMEFGGIHAKNLTREDFSALNEAAINEEKISEKNIPASNHKQETKGISSKIKEFWNKLS